MRSTDHDDEKMTVFLFSKTVCYISPRNDIKIVLGDFNAQVSKKAVNCPTYGNHILHILTNHNRSRVIQFAASRNMILESIFHPHKDIHNCTWRSLDGVTFKQIIF